MQVGDLVELSAYGKKIDGNHFLVGKIGLVTRRPSNGYYLKVKWMHPRFNNPRAISRRELKYAKCPRSSAG